MMCIQCNMMVVARDIRLNTSKFQSKGPYNGHFSIFIHQYCIHGKKALLSCKCRSCCQYGRWRSFLFTYWRSSFCTNIQCFWQPPVEMRFHLLFLAKPFCQISLFVIFLYFFGMPNIERYQKQEVMVVSSTKLSGGFPAPTISVSAMNNFTGRGWKSNIIPPAVELIDFYCGNASDIQKCILDGTYNRSDVVKYVQIGYNRNESLMDQRFWREVFQDPHYGRRFTLNIAGRRITPYYYQDQIYLQLRPGLFYTVYIFDQNFFLMNANRLSFPMTIKHVTSSGYFWAISVTETFELNHPKDPCFEGIFIHQSKSW